MCENNRMEIATSRGNLRIVKERETKRNFHLTIRKKLVLIVTILASFSFRVIPITGESSANMKREKGRIRQAIKSLSVYPHNMYNFGRHCRVRDSQGFGRLEKIE